MTETQSVVIVVLWLVLVVLILLVLVMYREVERAYARGDASAPGLSPGSKVPEVEVSLGPGQFGPLPFPDEDDLFLIAWVSPTCGSCRLVLDLLADPTAFDGPVVVLQGVGSLPRFEDERLRSFGLTNERQAVGQFGIRSLPMLFAVSGRTILAGAPVVDRAGLARLLQAAQEYRHDTPADAKK